MPPRSYLSVKQDEAGTNYIPAYCVKVIATFVPKCNGMSNKNQCIPSVSLALPPVG